MHSVCVQNTACFEQKNPTKSESKPLTLKLIFKGHHYSASSKYGRILILNLYKHFLFFSLFLQSFVYIFCLFETWPDINKIRSLFLSCTDYSHPCLLDHVRHRDFGVLLKHAGHQAVTSDVVNALKQRAAEMNPVQT